MDCGGCVLCTGRHHMAQTLVTAQNHTMAGSKPSVFYSAQQLKRRGLLTSVVKQQVHTGSFVSAPSVGRPLSISSPGFRIRGRRSSVQIDQHFAKVEQVLDGKMPGSQPRRTSLVERTMSSALTAKQGKGKPPLKGGLVTSSTTTAKSSASSAAASAFGGATSAGTATPGTATVAASSPKKKEVVDKIRVSAATHMPGTRIMYGSLIALQSVTGGFLTMHRKHQKGSSPNDPYAGVETWCDTSAPFPSSRRPNQCSVFRILKANSLTDRSRVRQGDDIVLEVRAC